MKDILVATYKRKDIYRGYSRINHYHIPTELRCYISDNSEERKMGILVDGEVCKDGYNIVEYNYKGDAIYKHHFEDKDSANNCFVALCKNIGGFRKIQSISN